MGLSLVHRHWQLALLIFLGLQFAVYGTSLSNGFVLDDEAQVLHHSGVHSLSSIPQFWLGSTILQSGANESSGIYFKPLMMTIYALLWWLTPGEAWLFHFFQIAVAAANGFLFFLLLRRWIPAGTALVCSLLVMVHPANSEVVLYIADLQDTLFMFWGLLALNLCLGSRDHSLQPSKWSLILGGLSLWLSLMSKETGALFLVLVPVATFLLGQRNWRAWSLTAAGILLAYLGLRFGLAGLHDLTHPVNQIARASLIERLWTFPSVLATYHERLFWPLVLTMTQDWVVAPGSWDRVIESLPWILGPTTLQLVALKWAWSLESKTLFRRILLMVLWVWMGWGLHTHLLVPLDGTVADRWVYFSSFGMMGFLALTINAMITENSPVFAKIRRFSRFRLRWTGSMAVMVVFSLFCYRSFSRAQEWKDNLTLSLADVENMPPTYYMEGNIGTELVRRDRYPEALPHIEKAVRLNPLWVRGWNNLGAVHERLGNSLAAEQAYRESIRLGPDDLAYLNFAALLYRHGRFSELSEFLGTKGLKAFPQHPTLLDLRRDLTRRGY